MELTLFINQICVLLFLTTQIWAAFTDMQRYEIPNAASLASILLYVPFALTAPGHLGVLSAALLATGVLCAGFLAFTLGAFGGGDAKLLTGVALWAGLPFFWTTIVSIVLSGGVLAIIYIILNNIRRARGKAGAVPFSRIKLPYGVAIAIGGIAAAAQHVLPYNTWLLTNGI